MIRITPMKNVTIVPRPAENSPVVRPNPVTTIGKLTSR